MPDDAQPPKPKPGSLRDRIAAFEKSSSSPAPAPAPVPRPKPAAAKSWKPKVPSPPSSPSAVDNVVSGGGMSASDAKQSIRGSLKDRMAALQGRGGFSPTPVEPKPVVEKPKWKPPPAVPHPDDESHQSDDGEAAVSPPIPDSTSEHHHEVGHDETAEPSAGTEEDPDEEERQRRVAIAARMARLGGARVGMGPLAFGGPAHTKPEVPKHEISTPSLAVHEQLPAAEDSQSHKSDEHITDDSEDTKPTATVDSSSTDSLPTKHPNSMPIPAVPRRAAPPRRKPAKPSAPPPEIPAAAVDSVDSEHAISDSTDELSKQVGEVNIRSEKEHLSTEDETAGHSTIEETLSLVPEPSKDDPEVESSSSEVKPEPQNVIEAAPFVESEPEEDEAARRKRITERLTEMGAINPFAPPPQRKTSISAEENSVASIATISPDVPPQSDDSEQMELSESSSIPEADMHVHSSVESHDGTPPPVDTGDEHIADLSDTKGLTPGSPTLEHVQNVDVELSNEFGDKSASVENLDEFDDESRNIDSHEEPSSDPVETAEVSIVPEKQSSVLFKEPLNLSQESGHASIKENEEVNDENPRFVPPPQSHHHHHHHRHRVSLGEDTTEVSEQRDSPAISHPSHRTSLPPPPRAIPPPPQNEEEGEGEESVMDPQEENEEAIPAPPPRRTIPSPTDEQEQISPDEPLPVPPRHHFDNQHSGSSPDESPMFQSLHLHHEQHEDYEDSPLPVPPRRLTLNEPLIDETPLAVPPPVAQKFDIHSLEDSSELLPTEEDSLSQSVSSITHPIPPPMRKSTSYISDHRDEHEILDEDEGDPIDPSFFSPPRTSGIKLPEVATELPQTSIETTENEEDTEKARRRTIAERMAKLGGIRFGAPPVPGPRPPKVEQQEDEALVPDSSESTEVTEEEEERARKERIAAKMASMGGMRLGMIPMGVGQIPQQQRHIPESVAPPPPRVSHAPPPPPEAESEHESLASEEAERVSEPEMSEIEEVTYEDAEPETPPPPVPAREGRRNSAQSHGSNEIPIRKATQSPPPVPSGRPPVPAGISARRSSVQTTGSRRSIDSTSTSAHTTHKQPNAQQSDFVMVEEPEQFDAPPPPPRPVSRPPPPRSAPQPHVGSMSDSIASQWELPSIPSSSLNFTGADDVTWTDDFASDVPPPPAHDKPVLPKEPVHLNAEDLMVVWGRVGVQVCEVATNLFEKSKKNLIGDGTYHGFVEAVIEEVPTASKDITSSSYGYLVYEQLGPSVLKRASDIMPGDISFLHDAKFKGHKGLQSYSQILGTDTPVVGVVSEVEVKKYKLKVLQANQHVGQQTVESVSYRLEDLKSGTVKIFRVLEE